MNLKGSVSNLVSVYNKRDDIDYNHGRESYFKYNKLMKDLGERFDVPYEKVTAVFVSTSPNNDYKNNLRSTISILDGWIKGKREDEITISTYNHCKTRSLSYLNGVNFLDDAKGLKIRSFYQNILDPTSVEPVTVDGHMLSAWVGRRMLMKEAAMARFKYREVANDVREAADQFLLIPSQFQAIIWFTWKRINGIVYNNNLNLFGDHWGLDIDVRHIKPFIKKLVPCS